MTPSPDAGSSAHPVSLDPDRDGRRLRLAELRQHRGAVVVGDRDFPLDSDPLTAGESAHRQ
jgi:hypothetical protein